MTFSLRPLLNTGCLLLACGAFPVAQMALASPAAVPAPAVATATAMATTGEPQQVILSPTQRQSLGLEVLLDDRQASPGVKFKDAELLGVPWSVVVGRGWAEGVVELRNRFGGETREVPVGSAETAIAVAISA